ncbi:hypothetical protein NQ317_018315 [Molorchus minor]|uniref:Uncharacterized protein n=1 Tax=Molorchus minor TaxID=1323400 RepID=A0ABQ9J1M1_9CUCU|nr:hypothetical protein NQ317_018315 [Molorchus minor]
MCLCSYIFKTGRSPNVYGYIIKEEIVEVQGHGGHNNLFIEEIPPQRLVLAKHFTKIDTPEIILNRRGKKENAKIQITALRPRNKKITLKKIRK